VAFAHEKGIAHRDLTPSNIMLGRHGETLVVDWGLARRLDHTGPDDPPPAWPRTARKLVGTRMGENVGTPRYMSPEQAVGAWDHFGPATDVFGLGAALYRVLVGRPPFDDPDDQVCREKAYRVDCPRPRQVDRSIPAALEAICLKAMMGDPEQRYASPLDLGRDLSRWVEHQPLSIPRAATVRAWEQQRVDEPS
jgi:serine/threonine protein kinase